MSAILRADHSSLSPQIACAFFERTSSAAASARALSLRLSSLSLARFSALSEVTAILSSFSLVCSLSSKTTSPLELEHHSLNSFNSSRVIPFERQNLPASGESIPRIWQCPSAMSASRRFIPRGNGMECFESRPRRLPLSETLLETCLSHSYSAVLDTLYSLQASTTDISSDRIRLTTLYAIVEVAFPKADITIDVFHVIKNQCDCLDEMRMRFKRKAISELAKEKREFNKKKKLRKKARASYRKKHPKKRGERRGRPRKRANEQFKPKGLSTGDTKVELFTRARYILPKSGEKWSDRQKAKANLLFELVPKLKEAYSLVCELRCIFKNKKLTRDTAKEKLKVWYKNVSESKIKELIAAKNSLKAKENEVLNYFVN